MRAIPRARWVGLAAWLAVMGLAVIGCTSSPPSSSDAIAQIKFARISGPMPPLSGPSLQGALVTPADYVGKVVVVNFWASWCDPCRREMPGLQSLWTRLRLSGAVAFIGVDYKDREGPATDFLRRFGVTYPSLSDPNGALGGKFHIPYLPATILVDPKGQMRYRLVGAQNPATLRGLIASLENA